MNRIHIPGSSNKKEIFLLIILIIIFSSFIYKGFFSRYQQDDYCYGSDFKNKGFFNAQLNAYFGPAEYNGNRYALTFLYGITELLGGTKFEAWMPGIALMGWLSTLTFLVFQLLLVTYNKRNLFLSIFISIIILTFTLYLAPDLYQVHFWRSGRFTYQSALILNTYISGRVLQISRFSKIKWNLFFELLVIGFISAGFSETTALFQLSVWSIFVIVNFILTPKKQNFIKTYSVPIMLIIVTCVGILFLALSPHNSFRMTSDWVKKPDFITFVTKTFRYGLDFILYSLHDKWLPFCVVLFFGCFFHQILNIHLDLSKEKTAGIILVLIPSLYLISVSTTIPTFLIRSVYPDNRAWFPVHFLLVIVTFVIGCLISDIISKNFKHIFLKWKSKFLVLLFLGLSAYCIRMIPIMYEGTSSLRARAYAWDQREEWIIQEKAQGKTHIIVPAFDSIGGITELKPDEGNWVNSCAARYYEVDGISAIENYNGVKPYFQ